MDREDYIIPTCEVIGNLRIMRPSDPKKLYISSYKINETEKETKKMEAKKCDRCGKLYEMPGACENPNGANVRFKFEKVYRAEEKSGTKIAEEQSKDIYIKWGLTSSDHYVDFCPDCRASLKKWFENPEKEGK